jgi:hypothetical protein
MFHTPALPLAGSTCCRRTVADAQQGRHLPECSYRYADPAAPKRRRLRKLARVARKITRRAR